MNQSVLVEKFKKAFYNIKGLPLQNKIFYNKITNEEFNSSTYIIIRFIINKHLGLFIVACIIIIWRIFKTGYRIKS